MRRGESDAAGSIFSTGRAIIIPFFIPPVHSASPLHPAQNGENYVKIIDGTSLFFIDTSQEKA